MNSLQKKKDFKHIQTKLDVDGAAFGENTDCVTLDDREVVNPINEPFDNPVHYFYF